MFSRALASTEPQQLSFYVVKVENVGAWIYDGVSTVCAAYARDERAALDGACRAFWDFRAIASGYFQIDDTLDARDALIDGGSASVADAEAVDGLAQRGRAFLLHASVWDISVSTSASSAQLTLASPAAPSHSLSSCAAAQARSLRIAACVIDEDGRVLIMANKNSEAALRLKWQLLRSSGDSATESAFSERWDATLAVDMQSWRDSEIDGLAAGDASALWIEKSPHSQAAIEASLWFPALCTAAAREQARRRAQSASASAFESGSRVGLRWDWPKGRRELVPAPCPAASSSSDAPCLPFSTPPLPLLLDSLGQALLCAALELQQEAGIDMQGVPAAWFRHFPDSGGPVAATLTSEMCAGADGTVGGAGASGGSVPLAGVAAASQAVVAAAAHSTSTQSASLADKRPLLLLPGAPPRAGQPAFDTCDVLVLPVRRRRFDAVATAAAIAGGPGAADSTASATSTAVFPMCCTDPSPGRQCAATDLASACADITPRGEFDLHAWVPLASLAAAAPSLVQLVASGDAEAFAAIVEHAAAVHAAAGAAHRLLLVPDGEVASFCSGSALSRAAAPDETGSTAEATAGATPTLSAGMDADNDHDDGSTGDDERADTDAFPFLVALPPAGLRSTATLMAADGSGI